MPQRISVDLGQRRYDVVVGRGLDADISALVQGLLPPSIMLVTDANVGRLHGARIEALLQKIAPTRRFAVPAGEHSKSFAQFQALCDAALEKPALERASVIVAFGGGVVGDLAGFLAATLLRGIAYVQIPTSLLAMVDSSVGGKTAINHAAGKNLIGAFWQPSGVVCDLAFLETLPPREYLSGLAEVVKYSVIGAEPNIEDLEGHKERIKARTLGPLEAIVADCVKHKARVVANDERETSGARAVLNFGHSVAHVLETRFPEQFLHGEAVSIGMCAALRVSQRYAELDKSNAGRVERLLKNYGLPVALPKELTRQDLLSGLGSDKKRAQGALQYVVTSKIGTAKLINLTIDDKLADAILGTA